MKTSELTGAALDWAVGTANGGLYQSASARDAFWIWPGEPVKYSKAPPAYSTDWAQGGPIIERERIDTSTNYQDDPTGTDMVAVGWKASYWNNSMPGTPGFCKWAYGPTPLIAAMRVFVSSKLGDEVEVPEELT